MAKRIADKELNDRNWDQEDEGEEAGTFSIASEDVLKNRPIKKAKRRTPGTEGESGTAFKAFKGFSLNPSATGGGAGFGGFGNGTGFKSLAGIANGNSRATTTPSFAAFTSTATASTPTGSLTFNGPASSTPPAAEVTSRQPNGSAPSLAQSSSSSSSSNSREYSRQLTALNCSVRDWIAKHVNDNPLCDLNPIFRDYERHLASIEQKYGAAAAAAAESEEKGAGGKQGGSQPVAAPATSGSLAPSSGTAAPAVLSQSKEKESTSVPAGVTFNFGKKVDSSVLGTLGAGGAPPTFSFSSQGSTGSLFGGQGSTTAPASAATFSFGAAKTEASSNSPAEDQNGGADEESEEPPKPVVTEVKEEDAFYSKKCKLFYKKENEFKEKGVGTLHLKQVADGKLQLLVRADTNLGNILLNIMVPASMPCSRTGKNNVMVVCVPNPPVDDKNPTAPVPLLIRVKTAEDADELHKMLQEKKA
ncbi:nuclear pore complex protein Nup50 [Megalops cyprinoides]|uniref:nuclear pore complex protein Nup50 n=1 Tax=Megalops cyprinoides TaxID=118141 RepID=UPI001864CCE8|nr:nuclear pore complex protein Nup50 [Megalops cyprinoides]XP_036375985.1 nuclear pore complex protein Nup50 [Megalops cyprinoides]